VSFDVVVAADLDWGIGKANALPWPKLRADLAHFRRVTSEGGKSAVIMGRNTWQSAEVAGKPLPRRLNIVVSRGGGLGAIVVGMLAVPEGVLVVSSLDAALAAATEHMAFVVGGAQLYALAFAHPALRWIYLTRVEARYGCDTHIPDLDRDFVADDWDGTCSHEDNGVRYRIERLIRRPGT
jgi:dihydrofolate reductase